ncbi:MAG: outer membrane beta-barrel protein [Bacteroidales bacterium]|nr:outer membrane beta-barrel protein [Bacteroidales bacterium]
MKSYIYLSVLLLLLIVTFFSNECKAQYEQKFTMQFSAGSSFIVSNFENEDLFDTGLMLNGGLQYNFSRKFSIIGLATFCKYGVHPDAKLLYYDVTYFSMGIGLSAKYKFFSNKKLRPYLLYGMSMCFVKQEFQFPGERIFTYEQPALPGLISGLGLEFDITDNITIFTQSGFNKVLPKEGDGLPPTESVYVLLGVNINMFKSKSL